MGQIVPTTYNERAPWERQPCDTDRRWLAFQVYRDQNPPRSLRRALDLLRRLHSERSWYIRTIEQWSADDAWVDRVHLYDRYLDRQRHEVVLDALAEDARDVANRHCQIARDAYEAAHSVVREWIARVDRGEKLEGWSPNEVRGMIKDMIMLERLVRGESTERVEHGVQINLSNLSPEELETLRTLEAKAGVLE